MKNKIQWFAFVVWESGVNQLGKKTFHWVVTSKFNTKKEVLDAYNPGKGYARKVKEVYTLKQLVETFGIAETKRILEDNRGKIMIEDEQNKKKEEQK